MGAREACGVVGRLFVEGRGRHPQGPEGPRGAPAQGAGVLGHRGQREAGLQEDGPRLQLVQLRAGARRIQGSAGIGHVRYSTKGRSNLDNAQPVQIGSEFSIAHNGTIVNAEQLAQAVSKDYKGKCGTDTKAAGYRLLQILKEENDWFYAFERLSKELIGSYSFVILNKRGEVFAVRDPRGYRPLCLGCHQKSRTYIAASESCALSRWTRSSSATSSRARWSGWAARRGAWSRSGSRRRSRRPTAPSSTPTSPTHPPASTA